MRPEALFNEVISENIWKHILKRSYAPIKTTSSKSRFCRQLYKRIISGEYFPSKPRKVIIDAKGNGISRLIPSFMPADSFVYYYCVKSMESYLVKNRVADTFGGFRTGGQFRQAENAQLEGPEWYMPPFSFNPAAWNKAWGEFTRLAIVFAKNKPKGHYVSFDIANFYDTIPVATLELRLKAIIPTSHSDEIDLLFFFLRNWRLKTKIYKSKTASIPMDEFGESSRLLSNFYLQPYDALVRKYAQKHSCHYLRFADDQIILAPTHRAAVNFLAYCSVQLNRIGLNINSKKVAHFNGYEKFAAYWASDIYKQLSYPKNPKRFEAGVLQFLEIQGKSIIGREESVLRRIANYKNVYLRKELRERVSHSMLQVNFLERCSARDLVNVYFFLKNPGLRTQFLGTLRNICVSSVYTRFLLDALSIKKKGIPIPDERLIGKKVTALEKKFESA
jgi:hypothetical protein